MAAADFQRKLDESCKRPPKSHADACKAPFPFNAVLCSAKKVTASRVELASEPRALLSLREIGILGFIGKLKAEAQLKSSLPQISLQMLRSAAP